MGQGLCYSEWRLFAKALPTDLSVGLYGMGALQTCATQPRAMHSVHPTSPQPPCTAQAAVRNTQKAKPTRDKGPTCVMDPR